jgi:hypothetical protein
MHRCDAAVAGVFSVAKTHAPFRRVDFDGIAGQRTREPVVASAPHTHDDGKVEVLSFEPLVNVGHCLVNVEIGGPPAGIEHADPALELDGDGGGSVFAQRDRHLDQLVLGATVGQDLVLAGGQLHFKRALGDEAVEVTLANLLPSL